jgi:hypothetical protein
MIELALALYRHRFGMQWSDDLLKASAVFIGAGLFIFVFFSVQLFLIYQLEKRASAPPSSTATRPEQG